MAEVAGPRVETLAEMARLVAARRGDRTRVEERSDPADPDREVLENGGSSLSEWLPPRPDVPEVARFGLVMNRLPTSRTAARAFQRRRAAVVNTVGGDQLPAVLRAIGVRRGEPVLRGPLRAASGPVRPVGSVVGLGGVGVRRRPTPAMAVGLAAA
jgi:hypothetical protein